MAARITATVAIAALMLGCASEGASQKQKGAVLGAPTGAAAGSAIAGSDPRAGGVRMGAAAGALAVGLIGKYLDDQAKELDAIPGAEVQRRDDSLLVHFSDAILFKTGRSSLMPGAYDRLGSLAGTLNSYPDSDVIVKGHSDGAGSETFNQRLSEERADRVRNYLVSEGVSPHRLTAIGFGESLPIASNETHEGRALNRRVEIEIRPRESVLHSS